jgi:hypothetical protein
MLLILGIILLVIATASGVIIHPVLFAIAISPSPPSSLVADFARDAAAVADRPASGLRRLRSPT